eukprot:TRINITY_DN3508_c1_g3_i1.p1 TRINITY_DN3508_c1_g3~~TRINITY_DN3508_c1_g3_i1.p1  ORF type:complete len:111 (-),score=10.18 TRINITY_DN3508_c1_g3_i1:242-574(-)
MNTFPLEAFSNRKRFPTGRDEYDGEASWESRDMGSEILISSIVGKSGRFPGGQEGTLKSETSGQIVARSVPRFSSRQPQPPLFKSQGTREQSNSKERPDKRATENLSVMK